MANNPALERPSNPKEEKSKTDCIPGDFHNPYNFIPVFSREKVTGELGDRPPVSHSQYLEDSWSGSLSITLTTQTPLLIPDAAQATILEVEQKKHQSFPIRMVDGEPYIAPTSLKGMLRSSYEAITNSRLSVFSNHGSRLAYRMLASEGLSLVPARIIDSGRAAQLMMGTTSDIPFSKERRNHKTGALKTEWRIPGRTMYAAWLPRYKKKARGLNHRAINLHGLKHEQEVQAWVQKINVINQNKGKPMYSYWKVCQDSLVSTDQVRPQQPEPYSSQKGKHQPSQKSEDLMFIKKGYLCITENNIDNKYNERLFFFASDAESEREEQQEMNDFKVKIDDSIAKQWQELIENYQATHQSEVEAGQDGPPQTQFGEVWSRHITGRGPKTREEEVKLSEGTLCYAKVKKVGAQLQIEALYPVMIARKLFEQSPENLLEETLQPATDIKQLSPADRVFGWVNQHGSGAHKGQLRVHSITCPGKDAIKEFTNKPRQNPGIALSILGQPKPSQTRFYTANSSGDPLDERAKEDGYQPNHQLRGRKVYPHHRSTDWKKRNEEQEFFRPEQIRDSQNRSMQGWIKPGSQFTFQIDVDNLSTVELGALLWLLDLEPNQYHRLGGGKPFGLGSVRLKIDSTDIRKGDSWREYYNTLNSAQPEKIDIKYFKDRFKEALEMENTYGKLQSRKILQSFKIMTEGFEDDLPICYPRNHNERTASDENFKWFEANEGSDKRALPLLTHDSGLPRFEDGTQSPQKHGTPQKASSRQGNTGKPAPPKLRK